MFRLSRSIYCMSKDKTTMNTFKTSNFLIENPTIKKVFVGVKTLQQQKHTTKSMKICLNMTLFYSSDCLSSRMPCISQATRMRTMCRQFPIGVRWSVRLSMITWCANTSRVPRLMTSSIWPELMNQLQASWSVQMAWLLCPSTTS